MVSIFIRSLNTEVGNLRPAKIYMKKVAVKKKSIFFPPTRSSSDFFKFKIDIIEY